MAGGPKTRELSASPGSWGRQVGNARKKDPALRQHGKLAVWTREEDHLSLQTCRQQQQHRLTGQKLWTFGPHGMEQPMPHPPRAFFLPPPPALSLFRPAEILPSTCASQVPPPEPQELAKKDIHERQS